MFVSIGLKAADTTKTSAMGYRNTIMIGVNYSRQVPVGLLSKRFGSSNSVGASLGYKFGRNFQIQGAINGMFGGKVKENNMFDTMIGQSGYLIDINGNFAEVRLYERGYNWHFDFGKVFPINRFDINSGLLVTAGAGFMQHKIKYTFQRTVLPQLEGEYANGYDRLTNGFMLRGFIGYQRIDKQAMFNFVAGIEVLNGYTKNRRSYNYDTRAADTRSRNDLLIGFKFGIMVNIDGRLAGTKKGEEGKFFD